MLNALKYKTGYKYQVYESFGVFIDIKLNKAIICQFFELYTNGFLHIKPGYAWDGASGPAIDTNSFMIPSLVHDVLYQMIREKMLPATMRAQADRILFKLCRTKIKLCREKVFRPRMSLLRACYTWLVVRLFGKLALKPTKVFTAR